MAYSLISLIDILEQILLNPDDQHRKNSILDQDTLPQIKTLLEKASSLRDIFAKNIPLSPAIIESLEDKVKDVAEAAQDALELHITAQVKMDPDLPTLNQRFEAVYEEIVNFMGVNSKLNTTDRALKRDNNGSPSKHDPTPHLKSMVVGVEQDLEILTERLTSRGSGLEIIPIVGMGGMGKTTLARILYTDFSSSSKKHFDVCGWVTVSQEFDAQHILHTLLECVTGKPTVFHTAFDLRHLLYQELFSRRYFIVLDDVWSDEDWEAVQMAFPKENKNSRIIVTTRQNKVVGYGNPEIHTMRFLSEIDSRNLLIRKACGDKSCTSDLQDVGERIAKSLKGLPLAIEVIGGLLSMALSKDSWEQIEVGLKQSVAEAYTDEHISGIFWLSYVYLPYYLKPCFLYMAAFAEDSNICASHLTYLWIAEGFLTPTRDGSLEQAAGTNLKDLVDRNLIFVRERSPTGEALYYGIHDILRTLCLGKVREKKFLYVEYPCMDDLPEDASYLRRVSVVRETGSANELSLLKTTSLTRSFRCDLSGASNILDSLCYELSLLWVLDISALVFESFPEEILQLVNLRFLRLSNSADKVIIPDSISNLRNLQVLWAPSCKIRSIALIFDLPQLRKFLVSEVIEEDSFQVDGSLVHKNLQVLSWVSAITVALLSGKLPNMKELSIRNHSSSMSDLDEVVNLTSFDKLETLYCCDCTVGSNFSFPESLEKLKLAECFVCMETIGELPKLQSLIVDACWLLESLTLEPSKSLTWEPSEDHFLQMRYIKLYKFDIKNWLADDSHFPVLEHLVIHYCAALEEIPSDIGTIDTLVMIDIDYCLDSVLKSAQRILKEQEEFGNSLQVQIGRDYDLR